MRLLEEKKLLDGKLAGLFQRQINNSLPEHMLDCYKKGMIDDARLDEAVKAKIELLHNAEKAKMERDIRGFTEGIQNALFYYLSMVKECGRFCRCFPPTVSSRLFPEHWSPA